MDTGKELEGSNIKKLTCTFYRNFKSTSKLNRLLFPIFSMNPVYLLRIPTQSSSAGSVGWEKFKPSTVIIKEGFWVLYIPFPNTKRKKKDVVNNYTIPISVDDVTYSQLVRAQLTRSTIPGPPAQPGLRKIQNSSSVPHKTPIAQAQSLCHPHKTPPDHPQVVPCVSNNLNVPSSVTLLIFSSPSKN